MPGLVGLGKELRIEGSPEPWRCAAAVRFQRARRCWCSCGLSPPPKLKGRLLGDGTAAAEAPQPPPYPQITFVLTLVGAQNMLSDFHLNFQAPRADGIILSVPKDKHFSRNDFRKFEEPLTVCNVKFLPYSSSTVPGIQFILQIVEGVPFDLHLKSHSVSEHTGLYLLNVIMWLCDLVELLLKVVLMVDWVRLL